ncbi:MAG: cytochrome b [Gammaproteobacteria bacterium]|nr:cytochrome b [Gammaproteobacteria bacterium]
MPVQNSPARYGLAAQTLHWVIVGLLITQFTLAMIADDLPNGLEKLITLARHKSVGITILFLAILRLCWRFADRPPPLPSMPRWQAAAALISHMALYALLFAMPLTGWMMSSASNYPVSWFGVAQLPDLVAPDPALKELLHEVHEMLAKILIGFAGLHVVGALKHQFLDHDGLMFRMLPWRPR